MSKRSAQDRRRRDGRRTEAEGPSAVASRAAASVALRGGSPAGLSAGSRRQALAAALLVAVATILVYLPSLRGEFLNWDDGTYVRYNGYLREFSWDTVAWAFTSTRWATNWHPLTWLSHAADVAAWGLESPPWGHHLTSVLLHGLNAALLLAAVRRLTGRLWVAVVVAALFAMHPLRVECVAWISERKELLATTFVLLTVLAYVRYAAAPSVGRYVPVALAFAAALLSKPMAVTVPGLLVLLDGWPLGRLRLRPWRWLPVVEKLPLAAMTVASCLVTMHAQTAAKVSLDAIGLGQRMANAVVASAAYLGQWLWPAPGRLVPFYSLWQNLPQGGVPTGLLALSAAVMAALTVVALVQWRRRPYLLVGWLWYLGTLVPVIGLVQVGSQRMADRYTYLPLIGPVIVLAYLADELLRQRGAGPWARRGAVAAGLLTAAVWAGLTVGQQAVWRDTVTLWRYTTSHGREARSPVAWTRLGEALEKAGERRDAVAAYRRAVELGPGLAEAHVGLAESLARLGDRGGATAHAERALALRPGEFRTLIGVGQVWVNVGRYGDAQALFRRALAEEPESLTARSRLAQALARGGQWEAAIAEFERVLAVEPAFPEALGNYGLVLMFRRQYERAIEVLSRATGNDPYDVDAWCNLGTALSRAGRRWSEATEAFGRAASLDPGKAEARVGLAEVAEGQGRPAEAVPHWREVVRLRPESAAARYRLARALAESGQTAAATEEAARVLDLDAGHEAGRRLLERLRGAGS
ncbi:MAG: tetratricopeptide repeat protein [Phycisphaerae bacterium]|nr:tetratricopeptide repeat protein [Phycisphaerae bacterium]